MRQEDDNDFSMLSTVRDFMGNHTADTAGVPAIAPVVATLTGIISQIDAAGTAQASPLTGIAGDKDVVRTTLEEAVFLVSEALGALAVATNNNTLLAEVEISRPGLDRLTADDLDAFATRVAARGTTNQTVLMGTYAITMAQVTAITTARTAFAPWVNKPRTAIAERAGQTASIPGLVRQGKLLLRGQLDRLMSRFRLTNPVLFAAYRTARAVVNRHGAGGTPAALEINSAEATGPTEATLNFATAGGAGAVTIVVQWKGPGEADFGHDVAAVRPVQVLTNAAWAGATVDFRTKSVDSAAHAAFSAVQSVSFA